VNAAPALRADRREGGLWWDLSRPGGRAGLVGLLAIAFAVGYPVLFRVLGPDVAAIVVLGVLPASLAFGVTGGIVAGALSLPVNMLLLSRIGPDALHAMSANWAGAAVGVCIGIAAGAARDLFERVRTESLEREIAHLVRSERELARANAELERARAAAERSAMAKTVLLGRVSHELRTPIAAIVGYIEMLSEELQAGALVSPEQDLKRIHEASRHLAALLDDLLDVARLESGHFIPRLERTRLEQVVREVSTIATPLTERRGNALVVTVVDPSIELVTDRLRLEQILLNLLANAAKFTDRGCITLRAAGGRRGGTEVVHFTVSDTGIGMTTEQAELAFEEFYQADPSGSNGTGLGLAITQQLCTHLGGTIALETAPGRGTVVTVTMPLSPPAPQPPTPPAGV
jgi:signal transduction histidine kinase